MLSAAMDQLDVSSAELSRQLGISYEHTRRLCAGETLPSRLLLQKIVVATGVPADELQLALQRDRVRQRFCSQGMAETASTSGRISLFEPLINALDANQMPAAYAILDS
jgi:transcriptional regulator with XRE-family HTH domain